jgi:NitT/TauT family transport system substrate-binding protein
MKRLADGAVSDKLYHKGGFHRLVGHLRTNLAFTAVAIASVLLSGAVLFGYLSTAPAAPSLRLGFFPNVTHAQALYGIATGVYHRALQQASGIDFSIQPQAFNAGPAAIQALLSNHVDIVFVGPSPTLNGLSVAPDILRVIAGASSGGALFVAQPSLTLMTDADFSGRKFATPQWGNTQDIALKHYLQTRGHKTLDEGGDVDVINAANAEILTLFKLGQIDGAWVPEPWATRLIQEANAKVVLDERTLWPGRQFVTTQVVTTKRYLERHPDIITSFLRTFVNLTLQLQRPSASDLGVINDEIYNVTTSRLKPETMSAAFGNFNVTYDPIAASLGTYLAWAQDLGFLSRDVQPGSLYDLNLLNQVLAERGLPPVSGR